MVRVLVPAIVAFTMICLSQPACAAGTSTVLAPPDLGFSIQVPGPASVESLLHTWRFQDGDLTIVVVVESASAEPAAGPTLDGFWTGFALTTHMTKDSQTSISLDGATGREFRAHSASLSALAHVFVARSLLYAFCAYWPRQDADDLQRALALLSTAQLTAPAATPQPSQT